jgi:hypothetical protein
MIIKTLGRMVYGQMSQKYNFLTSRVAQWSKALHHSASCATRDSAFEPRLCRSWLRPGGPWDDAQLA